jgi:hypothetical protein
MVDRKVVPFDEFYYQLKLTHVFQKHPVYRVSQRFGQVDLLKVNISSLKNVITSCYTYKL